MYMHLFTHGSLPPRDVKGEMLKTVQSLANYIVTDATDSELFTLRVVREVVENTPLRNIEQAIEKVRENPEP